MNRRVQPKSSSVTDSLETLLRDLPEDEKGGASATLGFTFQQWWAALTAVERLSSSEDFAILLEFKEDVAILDSATAPTTVEFCQVKKSEREGAWSLKDLHRRGRKLKDSPGYEPSILAKLYRRKVEFTGHPTTLRFVSNVGFKLPDEADQAAHTSDACLGALAAEQSKPVCADVCEQLKLEEGQVDLACLHVHQTNLPIREQEMFVGGKLTSLATAGRLPFELSQTTVAARMLASEVQQRASDTSYARSFAELQPRLLSRSQVLGVLASVAQSRPPLLSALDQCLQELDREGRPYLERKAIRDQRTRVCAEATDRTNMSFREVTSALLEAKIPVVAAIGSTAKLGELMAEVVERARAEQPQAFAALPLAYSQAIALLVISDALDLNVLPPATGSQSEAQE